MGVCTLEHIENVKDKLILVIRIYKLWPAHDRGFLYCIQKVQSHREFNFLLFYSKKNSPPCENKHIHRTIFLSHLHQGIVHIHCSTLIGTQKDLI